MYTPSSNSRLDSETMRVPFSYTFCLSADGSSRPPVWYQKSGTTYTFGQYTFVLIFSLKISRSGQKGEAKKERMEATFFVDMYWSHSGANEPSFPSLFI